MNKKGIQVLVIFFMILFVVIHSPILSMFNKLGLIGGIPSFLFALLLLWLVVIGILWYMANRHLNDQDHGN